MARIREQDELQTAVLLNGLPTCTFRSKPYHRIITTVQIGNSNPSAVKCYRGVIGTIPVASNLVGSLNTVRGDIVIPAGQAFFVQWSASGLVVRDAFAKVSWEKEDDPLLFKNTLSGLVWDYDLTSVNVGTSADQVSVSKVLVYDQFVTQTVVSLNHGPFFVGNMPYIHIHTFLGGFVGGVRAQLVWCSDKNLTLQLGQQIVDSRDASSAEGSLPVLGPYLRVTTFTDIQPRDFRITISQVQEPVLPHQGAAAGNTILSVNQFPIGAGATVNFDAGMCKWGWGYWYADVEAAVGGRRIRLLAIDYVGGLTLVDVVLAGKESQKTLILLPPQPLRIEVFNGGGAANFWGVIYHHAGPI
jgi:hypothetical protein